MDFPWTVLWNVRRLSVGLSHGMSTDCPQDSPADKGLCTCFGPVYDGLIYEGVALQGTHIAAAGRLLHVVEDDGQSGKGLLFLIHAAPSFPSGSWPMALSTMRPT